MTRTKVDRLRNYLNLITSSAGGLEAVIESRRQRIAPGDPLEATVFGMEARTAQTALESLAIGHALSESEIASAEAIIDAELRPASLIVDGTFTVTHPLWVRLSNDPTIKARIESVIPSVGRIELPGNPHCPYGGTAFVVGDDLIMTNRHVAEIFAEGVGDRRLAFISGARAGVDFRREYDRPTGPTLEVAKVVMIHPYWDMAILEVRGLSGVRPKLQLSVLDARDLGKREIFVIGYPFYDYRNPAGEQDQLFSGNYGVKRLQPGQLQGALRVGSFGKTVDAATHDCSTLGGNSGSAVFDLETGDVLALHFGGHYHELNYGVPSFALSRDSRVIDAGVAFSERPKGDPNDWAVWWKRADSHTEAEHVSDGGTPSRHRAIAQGRLSSPEISADGQGMVTLEVPLRVMVSLGTVGADRGETSATTSLEALRAPWHDTDYGSRTGYDPQFLGVDVPMPGVADATVLARTRDGRNTLHYQNFSIRMHSERRLAVITASNVTREQGLRRPEQGRDYSRRSLSGLGPNDRELWYLDPRLNARYQLPDTFFTKDRGAFDKGHIVRREDIAWGASYEDVVRANGDSFHVTNCSPQVASFNRSNAGRDNWGDLENAVFSEASTERLCVLAGPVLIVPQAVV